MSPIMPSRFLLRAVMTTPSASRRSPTTPDCLRMTLGRPVVSPGLAGCHGLCRSLLCVITATTCLFLRRNSNFDSPRSLANANLLHPGRTGLFSKPRDFEPGRPPDIAWRPFQFFRSTCWRDWRLGNMRFMAPQTQSRALSGVPKG